MLHNRKANFALKGLIEKIKEGTKTEPLRMEY